MTESKIREPRRYDAKAIRELCRIAHPELNDHMIQKLGTIASTEQRDTTSCVWKRTIDGTEMEVSFLHTMRVISPLDRQARAMIFCAPPMDWIIAQGRDSRLPVEDRADLAGALTELQLLATTERWRCHGYASRLLADAEDRYRAAGYRAIFAVIEHDNAAALAWYRKRGFIIGDLSSRPVIQFWRERMHQTAHYDHLHVGQLIGFKSLHNDVAIAKINGTVHIRGLLQDAIQPRRIAGITA